MEQVTQIVGATCVLVAYVLAQLRRMDPASARYLLLNAVGSGVLAVVALVDRQWGFVLVEGVWSLVSTWALAGVTLRRIPTARYEPEGIGSGGPGAAPGGGTGAEPL